MIEYWAKLAEKEFNVDMSSAIENTNRFMEKGIVEHYEIPESKGIIAWCVLPDFMGKMCVYELFMYIKKEYRDDILNLLKLLQAIEKRGQEGNMAVRISSSFDYRDNKMLSLLLRRGYVLDTVRKEF